MLFGKEVTHGIKLSPQNKKADVSKPQAPLRSVIMYGGISQNALIIKVSTKISSSFGDSIIEKIKSRVFSGLKIFFRFSPTFKVHK